MSILVAAGPDGALLEEIAGAYWTESRPNSWRIALRVAASHLGAQLPDGWDVSASDGRFRIVPGDGFIDAWRIGEYAANPYLDVPDPTWLADGAPFDDIQGIGIIDTAADRLITLIHSVSARAAPSTRPQPMLPPDASDESLVEWIHGLRRTIMVAPPQHHGLVAQAVAADSATETRIVTGDRRMLLPLGPFALAFPVLRSEIRLERGVVEPDSASRAFRVIAATLASDAADKPQRLLFANAHELDRESMKLLSLLIDRGRLSDFSMTICADHTYRDLRWLDFVRRSVTGGCDLVELS